jgi:hypothetical protein
VDEVDSTTTEYKGGLQLLLDTLIVLLFLKLLYFKGGFAGKGFGSKPQDDDERRGIFVFV